MALLTERAVKPITIHTTERMRACQLAAGGLMQCNPVAHSAGPALNLKFKIRTHAAITLHLTES